MKIKMTLLFLFCALCLQAQKEYATVSPQTYIYEITAAEADTFYQLPYNKFQPQHWHFHTLRDSVIHLSPKQFKENGHFIFVTVEQEDVLFNLQSFSSITAHVLNNKQDLSIQVFDNEGINLSDAEVFLQNEKISFSQNTQTYFSKKHKKGGFLKITAKGETIFYKLRKEENRWILKKRWQRFASTPIGRIITKPYRIGKGLFYYVRRGLKGNNWGKIYWRRFIPFRRSFLRIKQNKEVINGYMVLNKPKYQAGDTVKVKAYLTNHRGKPLKRPQSLGFKGGGRYSHQDKFYFSKEIIADGKGNFTYEFPLGDSLKLDKNYTLIFGEKMTQTFRLEDYQLDEVSWSVSSDKKDYEATDRVLLKMEGKDSNGNTIPDGEVQLSLQTRQIKQTFDSLVYIPDTLWTHNAFLDARGETEIIVPDSIFPAARLTVNVSAQFQNANGELENKNLTFDISKEGNYFKEKLTGNSLSIAYVNNGKVRKTAGELSVFSKEGKFLSKKEVFFPLKKELSPTAYRYNLQTENTEKVIFVKNLEDNIRVKGSMTKDSVFFQIINPHGIQVQYLIQSSKKTIEKGETSSPNFVFARKNSHPDKKYFITYTYLWAGEVKSNNTSVRGYKNLLKFAIEQDKKVLPGATSLVKIKVKDAKGKPASKVNLTAAAINAQFTEALPYKEPEVSYKKAKSPLEFNSFRLNKLSGLSHRNKITKDWYETFHLDSLFFYSQRFDAEADMVHYDTVHTDIDVKPVAQFAPHLLKNGVSVPVYFIYCNRDLVWYYETNDKPPFAFVGEPGYNRISLRTKDAEYTIDSVLLKTGYKAEIFIDIAKSKQTLENQHIKKSKKQEILSYQEKSLINKSIFQISHGKNKSPIFLWQDEKNIHILPQRNRQNSYTIGPFKQNKPLHFLQENNSYHTFKYESAFRYYISGGQEKLYQSPIFKGNGKIKLPYRKQVHLPGQVVYTQADIITHTGNKKGLVFKRPEFRDAQNGKVQVLLNLPKDTTLFFCFLEKEADSIKYALHSSTRNIAGLSAGDYKISYYTINGTKTQKELKIQPHTSSWVQWKNPVFIKDSTGLARQLAGFKDARPSLRITPDAFSFFDDKTTGIVGVVTEAATGKVLPNIAVEVYLLGMLAKKTVTDLDGKYQLALPAGSYQISLKSYQGGKKNIIPIFVNDSTLTVADWIFNKNQDNLSYAPDGFTLETVTVTSYKIPLIEQDNTTMGITITSEDISNLPKKSINGLIGKVSGVSLTAAKESVSIRGSRSDGTYYYIDGVRVSGNIIPQTNKNSSKIPLESAGTNEIYGNVIDAETGEPILFGDVVVYRNGALVTGTQTDFDGNYRISGLLYGTFDVVFKYVGYVDLKYEGVVSGVELNAQLSGGVVLESVVVVGYGVSNGKENNQRTLDFDENTPEEEPLTGTQLRTEFKDYAYWQPNLITNKKGEAYFTIRYPDNITSWKTYVLGMDRKKRGGVQTGNVKSFKPLMAQLATPRFLIAGDKTEIIGKSVNFTQDSFDIQTEFLMNEKSVQTTQNSISEALIESVEITAPNSDSLTLTYKLSTETYGDGEQRDLPIFPRGIEETIGDFHFLRGDTSLTLDFNPDFGEVNIYVESDALEVLLKDLKYLRDYRYGCNEQTASKLTALLLEKEIATQLNRPFEYEKEIKSCLAILTKRQNENGTWGWWSGNPANLWMTIYVLKALDRADKAGYKTTCLEKGLRWMRSEVHNLEGKQLLSCLDLFSSIGLNMDYEQELARMDSVNVPMFEHLTEVKIRQAQGLEYSLDSLQKYERETIFGGIYWGTKSYDWQRNDLQLTLLAYEIYGKENKTEKQAKILQFFMEKRGQHYGRRFGRNTFEIAQIVSLILPQVLGESKDLKEAKNTFKIADLTVKDFPFQSTQSPDKPLTIKKSGTGTLFFTAYQKRFNPAPKAKSDLFEVKTQLLQNNKKSTQLKQGEKAILEVTIDIKKEADYVMIEVPIPAGCSYGNKASNRYRSAEVHREYFKEKTSIFCQRLKQGTYTFTIELEPRFSGDYTLNPAKVEQMYFPVFYGRNGVKEIVVDD